VVWGPSPARGGSVNDCHPTSAGKPSLTGR
jgi:hypothetical protein